MKKATKTLLLMLCAVVLVVSSVLGTVAYLTSEAEVQNTFTVGKVEIDLNETDVDNNSNTKANAYHLVPGVPQTKDPTVTVKKDSEDCYVRAIVTVAVPGFDADLKGTGTFADFAKDFDDKYFLTGTTPGFNAAFWEVVGEPAVNEAAKTVTFTVNYKNMVEKPDADKPLEVLFDKIQAPNTLTSEQFAELAGMTIDVKAHAIQADSFVANGGKTAMELAWEAFTPAP